MGPAAFVAPGAAVSILYMATLGSLLTFSAGRALAVYFQAKAAPAAGPAAAGKGVGSMLLEAELSASLLAEGGESTPAEAGSVDGVGGIVPVLAKHHHRDGASVQVSVN